MIDSINFTIKKINIADLNSNLLNSIKTRTFYNKFEKNGCVKNGISFHYKNIYFTYFYNIYTLNIIANAHKLLEKKDITLADKGKYEEKFFNILNDVIVNSHNFKTELSRIDYCVDLKLDEKLDTYLELLNSNIHVFKYMKKYNDFDTSIYLKTKHGKQNLNIYNRYEKTKDITDTGILRLEVQNKKRLLKSEFNEFGILKELDNYWSIAAMEKYYFSIIDGYCYNGNHYKVKYAHKIIENSNLKENMKRKLKLFLLDIEKYGLEQVKNMANYNHCKISNYIKRLEMLDINPIPLFKNCKFEQLEGLTAMSRKIANEKYFI